VPKTTAAEFARWYVTSEDMNHMAELTNVAQRQSYGRTVSPGELLASHGSTSEDPTQGARDRDHSDAEDRAGAEPRC
jgi:hypothetical protein